ncbi:hypothetical protein MsAg5_12530 [Methanosarcinaceae archaeon Ag5]|uniref:UPF0201 protein MsAg5_12530 n=1 Tax=Methanolapillus africanus TaxID=3028297 RepID=A0AAE4SDE1_9EURY|nr:hypothetical protein [Methanosarcinaceae archaeon Ag5]
MDFKTASSSKYNVTFSAPVFPTENPDKVKRALLNLINYGRPNSDSLVADADVVCIDLNGQIPNRALMVSGGTELLSGVHYLIRKEEIIDTTKTALLNGVVESESEIHVFLNKQVAYVKRLNFPADEEPLGSIEIEIKAESMDALLRIVDWLAPPTKDGVALFELKAEEL